MKIEKVKVAILDNSIDSSVYNPVAHWETYLKVPCVSFKAKESHFPHLGDGYSHLLLTGSEASIVERENWTWEEVEIVKEAIEKRIPILGSCYGHQLLALALAGPIHVRRCAEPEVGWIPVEIKMDSKLLGKRRTAYSFSIHFDEVVNLDHSYHILASSEFCEIQAFQVEGKPVWGLQIHPEIDIPSARRLLRNLIRLNLRTGPYFEKALRSIPRDEGLIHRIVKTFLMAGRDWGQTLP